MKGRIIMNDLENVMMMRNTEKSPANVAVVTVTDARTGIDKVIFPADSFLSCFKPLDDIEEEEARWLIQHWIPEGQITLIAADGGIGKTTLWVHIAANLSSGRLCILDPPDYERKPMLVAVFSAEDSIQKKLKKKLRLAGANMENIIVPNYKADEEGQLHNLTFDSKKWKNFAIL